MALQKIQYPYVGIGTQVSVRRFYISFSITMADDREGPRPWSTFALGLLLSLFINLFALFGLFFIDAPRKRKFFAYGVGVGTFGAFILVGILVMVGVTAGGVASLFSGKP